MKHKVINQILFNIKPDPSIIKDLPINKTLVEGWGENADNCN